MEDLNKRNEIVQQTIEDILNNMNDDYITFLNQLDKFLDEVNNDLQKQFK